MRKFGENKESRRWFPNLINVIKTRLTIVTFSKTKLRECVLEREYRISIICTTKNCKRYKLKNKLNGQLSISQVRRFSLHFNDLIDCSSRTIQIKQYIRLF